MKSPMAQIPPMKKGLLFFSNPLKSGGEGVSHWRASISKKHYMHIVLELTITEKISLFQGLKMPIRCIPVHTCAIIYLYLLG